jgi:hypothetical protein
VNGSQAIELVVEVSLFREEAKDCSDRVEVSGSG